MEKAIVTLEIVRHDLKVKTFIEAANTQMNALGYTEHGFRHASIVAETAHSIIASMGHNGRQAELASISGYLHDIGNAVNRLGHPDTSAVLAFTLLNELNMPADEIAKVIAAIGNHEEELGAPVSALLLCSGAYLPTSPRSGIM